MFLQNKCLSLKLDTYKILMMHPLILLRTKLILGCLFTLFQNQNNTVFLLEMRLKNNKQVRKEKEIKTVSQFSYLLIWLSKLIFFFHHLLIINAFPTMWNPTTTPKRGGPRHNPLFHPCSNNYYFPRSHHILKPLLTDWLTDTHVREFIIWQAPWAGSMYWILCSDWLPEQARWSDTARPGLPISFPQVKVRK